jgi:hypothetical protein
MPTVQTIPFTDFILGLLGVISLGMALMTIVVGLFHVASVIFITEVPPSRYTLFYLLAPFPLIAFFYFLYFVPVS